MGTRQGYVGLAPAAARAGDEIAVLVGCCVPIVLRRNEGKSIWQVVGECYVHGIMNGEVLRTAVKERREHLVEDIVTASVDLLEPST